MKISNYMFFSNNQNDDIFPLEETNFPAYMYQNCEDATINDIYVHSWQHQSSTALYA